MNTAEELGAVFGFDVSDEAFWTASLDVLRGHIDAVHGVGCQRAGIRGVMPSLYQPSRDELAELLDRRAAVPPRSDLAGAVPAATRRRRR